MSNMTLEDVFGISQGYGNKVNNSRIPNSPIRQMFMGRTNPVMQNALMNDRTHEVEMGGLTASSPLRTYFDEKRNPPPKTQQEMDLEAFGQAVQNGLFKNISMGFNAGTTKPTATTGGLAAEALKGITSGTGGNAMAPQPQAAQPIQGASPGMQAPAPQVQQAPVMYQGKPAEGGGGQPVDIQTLLAPGLEAWQKAQDTGGDPSTWHKGLSLWQIMAMGSGLKTVG